MLVPALLQGEKVPRSLKTILPDVHLIPVKLLTRAKDPWDDCSDHQAGPPCLRRDLLQGVAGHAQSHTWGPWAGSGFWLGLPQVATMRGLKAPRDLQVVGRGSAPSPKAGPHTDPNTSDRKHSPSTPQTHAPALISMYLLTGSSPSSAELLAQTALLGRMHVLSLRTPTANPAGA